MSFGNSIKTIGRKLAALTKSRLPALSPADAEDLKRENTSGAHAVHEELDETSNEPVQSSTSTNHSFDEAFDRSDNFLRGELIASSRRRKTIASDRQAISYWRHETPPFQSLQEQHQTQKARDSYLDLPHQGMGMEISCLSSFITNSGQFSTYTPPTEPEVKPFPTESMTTSCQRCDQVSTVTTEVDLNSDRAEPHVSQPKIQVEENRNYLKKLIDRGRQSNRTTDDERSVA